MICAIGLVMSMGCPANAAAGILMRPRVYHFPQQTAQPQAAQRPQAVLAEAAPVEAARYSNSLHAGGSGYRYKRPREERVLELPEDGDMWHFVFVNDGSQESQLIKQHLSAAPRLSALTSQVMYHELKPTDPHVARYYAHDAKPITALTTSTGKVVYKRSGGAHAREAEEMADEVESAIQGHVADCGPDCKPDETTPESRIPDMGRDSRKTPGVDQSDITVLAMGAIAALALFAAIRARQNS